MFSAAMRTGLVAGLFAAVLPWSTAFAQDTCPDEITGYCSEPFEVNDPSELYCCTATSFLPVEFNGEDCVEGDVVVIDEVCSPLDQLRESCPVGTQSVPNNSAPCADETITTTSVRSGIAGPFCCMTCEYLDFRSVPIWPEDPTQVPTEFQCLPALGTFTKDFCEPGACVEIGEGTPEGQRSEGG